MLPTRASPTGESEIDHRPEWLDYPNGLKLASIPHQTIEPCQGCQAEFGQRHRYDCHLNPCPKCGESYLECDCTDPLLAAKVYHNRTQMVRAINALATQYIGEQTNVDYGTQDAAILAQKVAQFEAMVALDRAARQILTRFTRGQLKKLRDRGQVPRVAEQAFIMGRQAHKIWQDWFWK